MSSLPLPRYVYKTGPPISGLKKGEKENKEKKLGLCFVKKGGKELCSRLRTGLRLSLMLPWVFLFPLVKSTLGLTGRGPRSANPTCYLEKEMMQRVDRLGDTTCCIRSTWLRTPKEITYQKFPRASLHPGKPSCACASWYSRNYPDQSDQVAVLRTQYQWLIFPLRIVLSGNLNKMMGKNRCWSFQRDKDSPGWP